MVDERLGIMQVEVTSAQELKRPQQAMKRRSRGRTHFTASSQPTFLPMKNSSLPLGLVLSRGYAFSYHAEMTPFFKDCWREAPQT